MQIGMIGLGKMGMNMARKLMKGRHKVVAYNRSRAKIKTIAKEGATPAYTLSELVDSFKKAPRTIWLMLPAGEATEQAIADLTPLLKRGDTIVDGGNSYYKDDIKRAEVLKPLGINYMDAGVSGGMWGLKNGYCLMLGGKPGVYKKLMPIIKSLAPKNGYMHCGPIGSGHFVKMVHNGIEYGMMAAYGEGFEIMQKSEFGEQLNFQKVASIWNNGSVVRSWLLELAESAFKKDADLSGLTGHVDDSGEGRWTVMQAVETGVPAPVITASLYQRFSSRDTNAFSNRLLAALREEFGGHAVKKSGKKK